MSIKKKHVPGCSCCGCQVASGATATYQTCSGTWTTPSAGHFRTTSSNAKIIFDTPIDYTVPWRATVTVTSDAGFGQSYSASLHGGITNPGTGYCNGSGVHLDYTGSTMTLHGSTGTPTTGVLTLTWDGAVLTGTCGAEIISSITASPSGDRFGIATGTLVGGCYVNFSNFELWYIPADGQHSSCPTYTNSCCSSAVPSSLTLVLASVIGGDYYADVGGGTPYQCYDDCPSIDGTYVLNKTFSGDADCNWDYSFTASLTCEQDTSPRDFTIYIVVTVGAVTGGSGPQVRIYVDLQTRSILVLEAATTDPCSNWGTINLSRASGDCTLDVGYTATLTV